MPEINWDDDKLDTVLDKLESIGVDVKLHSAGALYELGQEVIRQAKRITPVDYGILRDSGHCDQPVTEGDYVSVTLGFGGEARDYAIIQHERLDFHHVPPGQAKFLETPMMLLQRHYAEAVKEHLRERLGM